MSELVLWIFFSGKAGMARWIGILLAVTNAGREEKALHLQLGKRIIFIALLSDNQTLMIQRAKLEPLAWWLRQFSRVGSRSNPTYLPCTQTKCSAPVRHFKWIATLARFLCMWKLITSNFRNGLVKPYGSYWAWSVIPSASCSWCFYPPSGHLDRAKTQIFLLYW